MIDSNIDIDNDYYIQITESNCTDNTWFTVIKISTILIHKVTYIKFFNFQEDYDSKLISSIHIE